ncbi:MAG: hydrogenase maturation nickel metallochaperone HypA [Magnetococcales bacterium]|nr:hydrogenase maturation nickel metallochaperone HypA [Magnetococcales bacterium]
MHELSVAMALVEQVRECMEREKFASVRQVTVSVGALSGVDGRALAFCFPLAIEGTPVAGAELIVEELPVRLRCMACGTESEAVEPCLLYCGSCASGQVEIIAGNDLILRSLEVT